MNNAVYLIGRIAQEPEIKESENGKKFSQIRIATPRNYKNEEGVYETDFFNVSLFNGIAINTCEYCKQGDLIGVKGRLENNEYEDKKTGEKKFSMNVIAEKVTFLSSKNIEKSNDDRDDR